MRSLSLVRMPCFRRCSMISTTSPNHEGVEGTECEEVWMMTEESAILVMCTSLLGKMCILPQERHILCLLATNYISLRNSWDIRCPGIEIMLGAIGETLLQEALGQWVVTGHDSATGQICVRAGDILLPSPLQGEL